MEEYPRTMQEFQDSFTTEDGCREYLFQLRWPEGFRCPRCGNRRAWAMQRRLFRCSECDLETSHGRHRLPGYAETSAALVSSDVVRDQPKAGGECVGVAASAGIGQLPHGVDLVAQACVAPWCVQVGIAWQEPWKSMRLFWVVLNPGNGRWSGRKGAGSGRGAGGWPEDRSYPFAADCRRLRPDVGSSYPKHDCPWEHRAHRHLARLQRLAGSRILPRGYPTDLPRSNPLKLLYPSELQ